MSGGMTAPLGRGSQAFESLLYKRACIDEDRRMVLEDAESAIVKLQVVT